jgi:hypothetical protein
MIIFVVPYRDREQQKQFFDKQMHTEVMKTFTVDVDYRILYIHQCDERMFNRGAMKNIGFLVVKELYPDTYKSITLVFNDVDVMPYTSEFLDYDTSQGVVKHFYGYKHTLGGIVSIKAGDFESVNGFPNYWAWGFEDNLFLNRVNSRELTVDRSSFYPIYDKNILLLIHDFHRQLSPNEMILNKTHKLADGITDIKNLKYDIQSGRSVNVLVTSFETKFKEPDDVRMQDSRKTIPNTMRFTMKH